MSLPQSPTTSGFKASFSIARTADTNAYTANDVIGSATGSTAAIKLDNIGPVAGGEIMFTTVNMAVDLSAVPSGMTSFGLHLYNAVPPSALGDNVAWDLPAGDRPFYVGYIDLGAPADLGSTLSILSTSILVQATVPQGGGLYAYLVTNGGYTPASGTVYRVSLHAIGL